MENIPTNLGRKNLNCYKMGIGRLILDDKMKIFRKT
jgi:hypothetical protein